MRRKGGKTVSEAELELENLNPKPETELDEEDEKSYEESKQEIPVEVQLHPEPETDLDEEDEKLFNEFEQKVSIMEDELEQKESQPEIITISPGAQKLFDDHAFIGDMEHDDATSNAAEIEHLKQALHILNPNQSADHAYVVDQFKSRLTVLKKDSEDITEDDPKKHL